MTAKPIDPTLEYILLGSNGATAVVDGGERFWAQPPGQLEKFGRGWLVSSCCSSSPVAWNPCACGAAAS